MNRVKPEWDLAQPHRSVRRYVGAACALAALAAVACSGKGAAGPNAEPGKRDTKIRTESCSKSAGFDTNRDGKPDLFEVNQGGRVTCRAVDLDFDGVIDQTTFFDASGVVRRRELDLNTNGVPDMVEHYKGGKIVLREIDGAAMGRFDTWDSFDAAGVRTTRERDVNGDGRIDQYWTFAGSRITVRFDRNEDGIPDEEGVLVWGEGFESAQTDGGVADAAAPAAEPDAGTAEVAPQAAPEVALTDAGKPAEKTKAGKDGGTK